VIQPLRGCADTSYMLGSAFDSILAATRAGAEWAWTRIYDDLAPVLLGYLRGRGAAEPEDLLGEVFLRVVRDLATFEGDERDFRSWVFTIAHHRLIDDVRRRGRRPLRPMAPEDLGEALGVGDTEQDALARLGGDRVRELISTLSPDQQDALLLRVVADLSVEEIGRAIGKRPGAVKALQRRALARLRKEMLRQGVSR
jgi:RNA polymerase sigma factor (sigma-70 family)